MNTLFDTKQIKKRALETIRPNFVCAAIAGLAFWPSPFLLLIRNEGWWIPSMILLSIFVLAPLQVGAVRYFALRVPLTQSSLVSSNDASLLNNLTYPFQRGHYLPILKAMTAQSLIIVLCTALLIIPGIIAALTLSLVPFLLAQNPQLKTLDVLKQSAFRMKGHREHFLLLNLSFLGWALLSIFSMGLLKLVTAPYAAAAISQFFLTGPLESHYTEEIYTPIPYKPTTLKFNQGIAVLILILIIPLSIIPEPIHYFRQYLIQREVDVLKVHLQDFDAHPMFYDETQYNLVPIPFEIAISIIPLVNKNFHRWYAIWSDQTDTAYILAVKDGLFQYKEPTLFIYNNKTDNYRELLLKN